MKKPLSRKGTSRVASLSKEEPAVQRYNTDTSAEDRPCRTQQEGSHLLTKERSLGEIKADNCWSWLSRMEN